MKRLLIVLVIVMCGLGFVIYHSSTKSIAQAPKRGEPTANYEPVEGRATNATLLAAVNAERAKYGAAPLTEDSRLDASAQAKACDEANNHYFGHYSPSGVRGVFTARTALGEVPGHYDENLTEPTPITTSQAMYNWNHSKLHHDGMINTQYTLTGFGVCGGEVVEHFYGAF